MKMGCFHGEICVTEICGDFIVRSMQQRREGNTSGINMDEREKETDRHKQRERK